MYYIYHIPGIKIGCTSDLTKRMRDQGFTDWEILEEHTDIYEASDREIELQKDYGLPIDTIPYWQSVEHRRHNHTKESKRKISEFQKGRVKSEEHKRNLSIARTGVPLTYDVWNKGIETGPLLQEHKDKISNKLKGKIVSKEHRKNLSLSLRTTTLELDKLVIEDRVNGLSQMKLAEKYNVSRMVIRRIINGSNRI